MSNEPKSYLLPDACPDGEHVPVIVHRSGGPSANQRNACGKCGQVIWRTGAGTWSVNEPKEKK